MTESQAPWDNAMIIPFMKRAPAWESLRERATDGISTWLFRLVDTGLISARTDRDGENPATAGQLHRFVRDVVTTNPVSRSALSPVRVSRQIAIRSTSSSVIESLVRS
jgi:hypothetical protein